MAFTSACGICCLVCLSFSFNKGHAFELGLTESPIRIFQLKTETYHKKWSFNRTKISECLFKTIHSDTGDILSTVCRQSLSKTEQDKVWEILDRGSFKLPYLDLYCNMEANKTSFKENCVCIAYKRLSQSIIPNNDDGGWKAINKTDHSTATCAHTGNITLELLRPFNDAVVLNLGSPSFQTISISQPDGTPAFKKAELLRIIGGFKLTRQAFGEGGICQIPSLEAVGIQISIFAQSFPTEWFGPVENGSRCPCGSLQALFVDGNRIEHLQAYFLPCAHNLRSLVLTNNRIQDVDEMAFTGLNNLKELHVDYNEITHLPDLIFLPLVNVTIITLNYNQLYIFNASALKHIKRLATLDLSHNYLVAIDGSFINIETLFISDNFLSSIKEGTFQFCYYLSLHNNNISYIEAGSFQNLDMLQKLVLSKNQLYDVDNLKMSIWNLSGLEELFLGDNNLIGNFPSLFSKHQNGSQLKGLDISGNRITKIEDNFFLHLYSLEYLFMDSNSLVNISHQVFQPLNRLKGLNMTSNNLTEFPIYMLPTSLELLALAENNLRAVPMTNKSMTSLTFLDLDGNQITELSEHDFINFPGLILLSLARNMLTTIHADTFLPLKELTQLDLSYNHIDQKFLVNNNLEILHFPFVATPYLPFGLQKLNLSYNKFYSLAMSFLITLRASLVREVDMSFNPITSLPDKEGIDLSIFPVWIDIVRLRGCNISWIPDAANTDLWYFTLLDLSFNQLKEFKPLPIVAPNGEYNVVLKGNPLKCSCHMKWLLDSSYRDHYSTDYCEDQVTRSVVAFDSVGVDRFLCRNPKGPQCLLDEDLCTCFTDDSESKITSTVVCSMKNLTTVPAPIPHTTVALHLDGNIFETLSFQSVEMEMMTEILYLQNSGIVHIENGSFSRFPYLSELYLEHNHLNYVPRWLFARLYRMRIVSLHSNEIVHIEEGSIAGIVSLEHLYLAGNMLQSLNHSTLDEISSLAYMTKLTLGNNPWACKCDNVTFKGWIQMHSDIIGNLLSIECNESAIIDIPDNFFLCYENVHFAVHHNTNRTTVAVISTIAVLALCVIVLGIIAYKKRFLLEVLLYNRFNLRQSFKENPSCQYDAIIAYDGEDYKVRTWIRSTLIGKLEPVFQLCIPDRDILPGTVWTDALVEAIQTSRRTCLVLSDTGMENENLLYVFQSAYHHMKFEDPAHRIFIVLLSDADKNVLMASDLTDPHVKAMLKVGQMIQEGDRLFWEKLRFKMPKPTGNQTSQTACQLGTI